MGPRKTIQSTLTITIKPNSIKPNTIKPNKLFKALGENSS